MKAQIVYIKGHQSSEAQAEIALRSFEKNNWDIDLTEGVTPDTIDESEFPYQDLPGGRLESFKTSEPHKYLIKKSCIFNNLRFYQRVIEANEPMIFLEHDAICCGPEPKVSFEDYLFLSFDGAFKPPTCLAVHPRLANYKTNSKLGVNRFPSNYPLRYYKNSMYKGAIMSPGTCAYAVTPKGAKKLLEAAKNNGLEQSDFHINENNVIMEYYYPSPVKYNSVNLNTSHNIR